MDLIGTLDVEEKTRAKDTRARGIEGGSSANLVHKKNFQPHKFKNKGKFDGKAKFDGKNKVVQHTNFKKKNDKKKGVCHVCGDPDHWAPSCPNRYDKLGGLTTDGRLASWRDVESESYVGEGRCFYLTAGAVG